MFELITRRRRKKKEKRREDGNKRGRGEELRTWQGRVIGENVCYKMCTPICASPRVASSNIMKVKILSHEELGY